MIFFMTRSSRSTAWASWTNVVRSTFFPYIFFQNIKIIGGSIWEGGRKRRVHPLSTNFFIFMQFPGENGQIIAFHVYLWSWCPLWDILNSQLKILGHTLEGLRNISNYRAKYNFRVICSALSDHHHFMRLWHHLHNFSLLLCKCERSRNTVLLTFTQAAI